MYDERAFAEIGHSARDLNGGQNPLRSLALDMASSVGSRGFLRWQNYYNRFEIFA